MSFKEMDPEVIRGILEARDENGRLLHQDLLGSEAQKEQAFFRNSSCPACGGTAMEPFVNPRRPFTPGSPLPAKLLRCAACRTEFDPYTRVITYVRPDLG